MRLMTLADHRIAWQRARRTMTICSWISIPFGVVFVFAIALDLAGPMNRYAEISLTLLAVAFVMMVVSLRGLAEYVRRRHTSYAQLAEVYTANGWSETYDPFLAFSQHYASVE